MRAFPRIIQGGMGIAVSNWKLAQTVAAQGQLGVVSATAINSVLVRRLQQGDPGGHCRLALKHFPNPDIAAEILKTYFVEGGIAADQAFTRSPMFTHKPARRLLQLTVAASFVEVFLAKQGHAGQVGVNLLEKIHTPNLACLYGALLADVDLVIMGAGIPREIPGALDLLAENRPARLKLPVQNATSDYFCEFDPVDVMQGANPTLRRPAFFPIVSSVTLATSLKKKSTGEVQGFIVEGPKAGGHNAPPRGVMQLNARGEPIYGPRDEVLMSEMVDLGLPFYMAGSVATPEELNRVVAAGAQGIQVGTLFAFTKESGLAPELRRQAIAKAVATGPTSEDSSWIFTDPRSSPTGFPFKVAMLNETLSEDSVYQGRTRICDLGYLRHAYETKPGELGFRCPAEPVQDYQKKGGLLEDTLGRKCLCNALMTDIGLAQRQKWGLEPALVTAGDDLVLLGRLQQLGLVNEDSLDISAQDIIAYLLTPQKAAARELPQTTAGGSSTMGSFADPRP